MNAVVWSSYDEHEAPCFAYNERHKVYELGDRGLQYSSLLYGNCVIFWAKAHDSGRQHLRENKSML